MNEVVARRWHEVPTAYLLSFSRHYEKQSAHSCIITEGGVRYSYFVRNHIYSYFHSHLLLEGTFL